MKRGAAIVALTLGLTTTAHAQLGGLIKRGAFGLSPLPKPAGAEKEVD